MIIDFMCVGCGVSIERDLQMNLSASIHEQEREFFN